VDEQIDQIGFGVFLELDFRVPNVSGGAPCGVYHFPHKALYALLFPFGDYPALRDFYRMLQAFFYQKPPHKRNPRGVGQHVAVVDQQIFVLEGVEVALRVLKLGIPLPFGWVQELVEQNHFSGHPRATRACELLSKPVECPFHFPLPVIFWRGNAFIVARKGLWGEYKLFARG
jgi:hypothetical protein